MNIHNRNNDMLNYKIEDLLGPYFKVISGDETSVSTLEAFEYNNTLYIKEGFIKAVALKLGVTVSKLDYVKFKTVKHSIQINQDECILVCESDTLSDKLKGVYWLNETMFDKFCKDKKYRTEIDQLKVEDNLYLYTIVSNEKLMDATPYAVGDKNLIETLEKVYDDISVLNSDEITQLYNNYYENAFYIFNVVEQDAIETHDLNIPSFSTKPATYSRSSHGSMLARTLTLLMYTSETLNLMYFLCKGKEGLKVARLDDLAQTLNDGYQTIGLIADDVMYVYDAAQYITVYGLMGHMYHDESLHRYVQDFQNEISKVFFLDHAVCEEGIIFEISGRGRTPDNTVGWEHLTSLTHLNSEQLIAGNKYLLDDISLFIKQVEESKLTNLPHFINLEALKDQLMEANLRTSGITSEKELSKYREKRNLEKANDAVKIYLTDLLSDMQQAVLNDDVETYKLGLKKLNQVKY